MLKEPPFTIGIEEEYLLVDPASRNLIREAPEGLLAECQRRLGEQPVRIEETDAPQELVVELVRSGRGAGGSSPEDGAAS